MAELRSEVAQQLADCFRVTGYPHLTTSLAFVPVTEGLPTIVIIFGGGVLGLSVTNTGRTSSALPGILRKTTTRWRSPYSRVDQERLS